MQVLEEEYIRYLKADLKSVEKLVTCVGMTTIDLTSLIEHCSLPHNIHPSYALYNALISLVSNILKQSGTMRPVVVRRGKCWGFLEENVS
jgi:hypothetical protein